jgi:SAM-dependent methyltransferase
MTASPYDVDECFDRRALQLPEGRRKARLFKALVPDGCKTILDAGGGTGWATIELREGHHVVTLDSSAESLRQAPGETLLASIIDMPCADRSFDLVISSQVLEHLPADALAKAVAEMSRVARDYLLVSVPYREALDARLVRCGQCKSVFHPDHHCQSFGERDLARLFPGWMMAEWHVFGAVRHGSGVVQAHGRKRASDLYPAFAGTICPDCGHQVHEEPPETPARPRSLMTRAVQGIARRLRAGLGLAEGRTYETFLPQATAPYWIVGLFVREASPAAIDADIAALKTPKVRKS